MEPGISGGRSLGWIGAEQETSGKWPGDRAEVEQETSGGLPGGRVETEPGISGGQPGDGAALEHGQEAGNEGGSTLEAGNKDRFPLETGPATGQQDWVGLQQDSRAGGRLLECRAGGRLGVR